MDNLPIAMILATRATRRISHSALPDAPVVPDRPRRAPVARATRQSRTVLARGLRRVAAVLAPEAGGGAAARAAVPAPRTPSGCVPAA